MYKLGRIISFFYIYVFNKIKIVGKENIPSEGAIVVCANHHSAFDILLLTVAFSRRIFFLAKAELFKIPILKSFLKGYGAIPVDRANASVSSLRSCLRVLKDGGQLGIFPEGTRYNNGDGSDAKGGAAMFAYKCKVKVLPVHLIYKRNVNIFNRYTVIIGKAVNYNELGIEKPSSEEYTAAGNRIMEKVYEL